MYYTKAYQRERELLRRRQERERQYNILMKQNEERRKQRDLEDRKKEKKYLMDIQQHIIGMLEMKLCLITHNVMMRNKDYFMSKFIS